MLDILRKVLGKPSPQPPTPKAANTPSPAIQARQQFEALNQLAPVKNATETNAPADTSTPPAQGFVLREPVLNRKEQIAGYTFSLHEHLQSRLQGKKDLLQKVYDDVLLRNLTRLRIPSLLGHRLAFVSLSPISLGNPLIGQLPPKNTVLMLRPGRLPLEPALLREQLDTWHQAGFSHGWVLQQNTLAEHPGLQELLPLASYVQLQTTQMDGLDIKALGKTLQAIPTPHTARLRLMGQELQTYEEFHLCYQSRFDYFSGPFVTSREDWHPPKSQINRILAMKLLNMLRADEELPAIAQQITADPVMTFKLLRYLNAPAIGLPNPVLTIDKALMLLGRERCYRWLSLLLFDIKQTSYRERVLTEQALSRAFFLEGLAGQGRVPPHPDQLFILGLFSLLDVLIGDSLSSILEQTRLPEHLHGALLGQPGEYGNALALAKASENPAAPDLAEWAAACEVDAHSVLQSSLHALDKANAITALQQD